MGESLPTKLIHFHGVKLLYVKLHLSSLQLLHHLPLLIFDSCLPLLYAIEIVTLCSSILTRDSIVRAIIFNRLKPNSRIKRNFLLNFKRVSLRYSNIP